MEALEMIFDGTSLLIVVHTNGAFESYQVDISTLQAEQIAKLTHAKPEKTQRSQNFIIVEDQENLTPIEIKTLKAGKALSKSVQISNNDDLVVEQLGSEVRIHDLAAGTEEKKIMLHDYSCIGQRMHATEN